MISAKQWKEMTSSTFAKRSPALKAIDSALENHDKVKTPASLAAVKTALEAWKTSKGADVGASVRNRNGAVTQLERMIAAGGVDTDAAFTGGPVAFQRRAKNSRDGVLYLWSNLHVSTGLAQMLMEGGLSVLNSTLSFAGAETRDGGLGNAAASALGNIQGQIQLTGFQAKDLITAAPRGAKTPMQQPVTLKAPAPVVPPDPGLISRLRVAVETVITRIARFIAEKWGNWETFGRVMSQAKSITMTIVNFLAAKAAPVVGAAMDMAKGLVNMADAAMIAFRKWLDGRHVVVAAGHPTAVVNAIQSGIRLSAFEGLWQFLKGAANLGATFGAAGAGLATSIITTVVEVVAKIVYRLFEASHIGKFIESAKQHWANRDKKDALVKRPAEFSRWFASYALRTPVIGILTLNSNICGDKMVYLSMFSGKDQLRGIALTDEEEEAAAAEGKSNEFAAAIKHFEAGTKMLDDLKPWGAEYLANCGISLQSVATDKVRATGVNRRGNEVVIEQSVQSKFHENIVKLAFSHAQHRNGLWKGVRMIANA